MSNTTNQQDHCLTCALGNDLGPTDDNINDTNGEPAVTTFSDHFDSEFPDDLIIHPTILGGNGSNFTAGQAVTFYFDANYAPTSTKGGGTDYNVLNGTEACYKKNPLYAYVATWMQSRSYGCWMPSDATLIGLGKLVRNNGSGYSNFSYNHFANPDNMLAQKMVILAQAVPNDVRVCACPVVSQIPSAMEKSELPTGTWRMGTCHYEDFVDNGWIQGGLTT